MPAIVRFGDLSAGLDAPPTQNIEASTNVFVNSKGVHRNGDAWAPHGVPPHGRVTIGGSNTVYVNGRKVARIGDAISCGDIAGQGSSNVFSG
jgi:uncharacterized Zn-binding protein involved in type VI secretion